MAASRPDPRRALGWAVVALTILAGTVLTVGALTAAPAVPPSPSFAARRPGGVAGVDPVAAAPPRGPSLPERLRVGAIGVDAALLPVGILADGSVEVPPAERADLAGWYAPGPTPGEVGNAVLVGHVDSRTAGAGVFFDLGRLRPGDELTVSRHDGSVGRFRVDGVETYPKAAVPGDLVFGASGTPGLRLITCGGEWDAARRSYTDNVVAYATLVAWERDA